MEYIRRTYGVPAKRGGKILFRGLPCTIRSSRGSHLNVTADRDNEKLIIHPTWKVTYL